MPVHRPELLLQPPLQLRFLGERQFHPPAAKPRALPHCQENLDVLAGVHRPVLRLGVLGDGLVEADQELHPRDLIRAVGPVLFERVVEDHRRVGVHAHVLEHLLALHLRVLGDEREALELALRADVQLLAEQLPLAAFDVPAPAHPASRRALEQAHDPALELDDRVVPSALAQLIAGEVGEVGHAHLTGDAQHARGLAADQHPRPVDAVVVGLIRVVQPRVLGLADQPLVNDLALELLVCPEVDLLGDLVLDAVRARGLDH